MLAGDVWGLQGYSVPARALPAGGRRHWRTWRPIGEDL